MFGVISDNKVVKNVRGSCLWETVGPLSVDAPVRRPSGQKGLLTAARWQAAHGAPEQKGAVSGALGTLSSRDNSAPSSLSSISRGSRSSTMVSAVRNTADRPGGKRRPQLLDISNASSRAICLKSVMSSAEYLSSEELEVCPWFKPRWCWVSLSVAMADRMPYSLTPKSTRVRPVDGVMDVVETLYGGATSMARVVDHIEGPAYQEGSFGILTPTLSIPGVLYCQTR
ncbi:hypothetical protein EYF80_015804 [Liparis tanakae]|uniref:Uncharacterized protein n=1 Tax=Liparis tanakae TaxID=230148 RepID=A0A4Z2IA28_9TELE|nr:hypothetical protein EYF80_015804 [Liparis tanakae]